MAEVLGAEMLFGVGRSFVGIVGAGACGCHRSQSKSTVDESKERERPKGARLQCREGAVDGSGCHQAAHGSVVAWCRMGLCCAGCEDV